MLPWRRPKVSPAQAKAEEAIAANLLGGESLPAWNAVWDLVQSRDTLGKQQILHELRAYVADAVSDEPTAQAREFERAIDDSMRTRRLGVPEGAAGDGVVRHARAVPPSKELRQQAAHDQIETHRAAMRDIGVRPGDGIPMWALYMTRKSKRSWG